MSDGTMQPSEIQAMLPHFPSTEQYYQHFLGMKYTEGVHFLVEQCRALWLLDILISHQSTAKRNMHLQEFQLWELHVDLESRKAVLTCREEEGLPAEIALFIPYTDFPLDYIQLYVEGKVVLLPAEY